MLKRVISHPLLTSLGLGSRTVFSVPPVCRNLAGVAILFGLWLAKLRLAVRIDRLLGYRSYALGQLLFQIAYRFIAPPKKPVPCPSFRGPNC
jgi:hypothetical protein